MNAELDYKSVTMIKAFDENLESIRATFEARKAANEQIVASGTASDDTLKHIEDNRVLLDQAILTLRTDRITSLDQVEVIHLARQSLVDPNLVTVAQVQAALDAGALEKREAISALHQIGPGNENNIKLMPREGAQGTLAVQEVVVVFDEHRKVAKIVTDPVNLGTPNLIPGVNLGHHALDVLPSQRWGNTLDDPTTEAFRTQLYDESIIGVVPQVNTAVSAIEDNFNRLDAHVARTQARYGEAAASLDLAKNASDAALLQALMQARDNLTELGADLAQVGQRGGEVLGNIQDAAGPILGYMINPFASDESLDRATEALLGLEQPGARLGDALGNVPSSTGALTAEIQRVITQYENGRDIDKAREDIGEIQRTIARDKEVLKKVGEVGSDVKEAAYSLPTKVANLASTAVSTLKDIGKSIGDAFEAMKRALFNSSPLVLDLDGDGIELISLQNSVAFFDLTEDGLAELTGWARPDDGFLALDRNANRRIDSSGELFGSRTEDGFSQLALLDSNGDGVISDADAAFDDLVIWQDGGISGLTERGELRPLSDHGITQIALDAQEVSQSNAGHDVSHIGTYMVQTADGIHVERAIHDIWFQYDPSLTRYSGDARPRSSDLWLPDLRGYGKLANLSDTLALNPGNPDDLRALLIDLSQRSFAELFSDPEAITALVRDIVFAWADVAYLDPSARGDNVDARELAVLEALSTTPFLQRGWMEDPGYFAGLDLQGAFQSVMDYAISRLVLQTGGNRLFVDGPVYDASTDRLSGGTDLDPARLAEITALALGTNSAVEVWSLAVRVISFGTGLDRLGDASRDRLEAEIALSDPTLDLPQIEGLLEWQSEEGVRLIGTNADEEMAGSIGDDDLSGGYGADTIRGGLGADRIDGGPDDDALFGDAGADLVHGSFGNDTYHYFLGSGVDTYVEEGRSATDLNDRILFGPGIAFEDLRITRVSNSDLRITLTTTPNASITIEDQFGLSQIEYLVFFDGSSHRLDTQAYELIGTRFDDLLRGVKSGGLGSDTIRGGDGNDTIYAYAANQNDYEDNWLYGDAGDDSLFGGFARDLLEGGTGDDELFGNSGDDILAGGRGNDTLDGGFGDDTYRFALGDGQDTIRQSFDRGMDTIALGPGITTDMLEFRRDVGRGLTISIDGAQGDRLEMPEQFTSGREVEYLSFTLGETVSLLETEFVTYGTEAAERIYGIWHGGSSIDLIYGGDGNDEIYAYAPNQSDFRSNTVFGEGGRDTIKGGRGADLLNGGTGADTVDGGTGNDTLVGGPGNDVLIGGLDIDEVNYSGAGGAVEVYLNANRAKGADGYDRLQDIENATGSAFSDRLVGNAQSNLIKGGEGDDILKGKGGNDWFEGGDGDDKIVGAEGNDSIFGGAGTDILFGLAGDDYLDGGADRDFIYGGRDRDTIVGGSGDDEVRGNLGNDVITGGDGADDLRGGGSNDDLSGEADNDFLFGENGRDRLDGGAGNDVLTGGAGSGVLDGQRDVFVFASSAAGSGGFDRIKDFEDGLDQIDLTAFGFTDFDAQVEVLASQRTGGLRIDFGGGDVLFIEGFDESNFQAGDVILS